MSTSTTIYDGIRINPLFVTRSEHIKLLSCSSLITFLTAAFFSKHFIVQKRQMPSFCGAKVLLFRSLNTRSTVTSLYPFLNSVCWCCASPRLSSAFLGVPARRTAADAQRLPADPPHSIRRNNQHFVSFLLKVLFSQAA